MDRKKGCDIGLVGVTNQPTLFTHVHLLWDDESTTAHWWKHARNAFLGLFERFINSEMQKEKIN